MVFIQNESGKRTGVFTLKTVKIVLSNTVSIYGYKNYAKETPGKNQPNTQQILRIVRKSPEMEPVQWLLLGTHHLDVVIDQKDVILYTLSKFVVFL